MLIRVFAFMVGFALLIAWFLQMATSNYDQEVRIVLKDAETEEIVPSAYITVYPNFELKASPSAIGRGNYIYYFDSSTPAFFIVETSGYKKKYDLTFLRTNETHTIYLERNPETFSYDKHLDLFAFEIADHLSRILTGIDGPISNNQFINEYQIKRQISELSEESVPVKEEYVIIDNQAECNRTVNSVFDENILCVMKTDTSFEVSIFTPEHEGQASSDILNVQEE